MNQPKKKMVSKKISFLSFGFILFFLLIPIRVNQWLNLEPNNAQAAARPYYDIDMFCFTDLECREFGGTFKIGNGCPNKGLIPQGYCRAPEPDYNLQNPVFGATTIRGLHNYIALMFNSAIGLLIVFSAVFFMWGAFKYLVSSVARTIEKSKEIMVDALVGLALGLGSYVLLLNINPNTLEFKPMEINMVNRINFFNVVYCNQVAGGESLKYMDAGTPTKPKDYKQQLAKEGYNIPYLETECGTEYFIEGGDSNSICMGVGCQTGACISCAAGASSSCQENNAFEHGCVDMHFGGTTLLSGPWDTVRVDFVAECLTKNSTALGDVVSLVTEAMIKSEDIKDFLRTNRTTSVSSSAAGGEVSTYEFKFNSGDIQKLKKAEQDCKKRPNSVFGIYPRLLLQYTPQQLVQCVGCDTSGQQWIPVTKSYCNKEAILCVDRPAEPTTQSKILAGADEWEAYMKKVMADAWQVSEIEALTKPEATPVICGITATSDPVKKAECAAVNFITE